MAHVTATAPCCTKQPLLHRIQERCLNRSGNLWNLAPSEKKLLFKGSCLPQSRHMILNAASHSEGQRAKSCQAQQLSGLAYKGVHLQVGSRSIPSRPSESNLWSLCTSDRTLVSMSGRGQLIRQMLSKVERRPPHKPLNVIYFQVLAQLTQPGGMPWYKKPPN